MRSKILKAAVEAAAKAEIVEKMIRGGSSATYHRLSRARTGLRQKAENHMMNPDADDEEVWDSGGLKGRAYEMRAAKEAGQRARIGRIGNAMDYLRNRRQRNWEYYRIASGRDDDD